MTTRFVGYQCWKQERIGVVINKEALSVDRANFLATHVPMRHIVYERAPRLISETSEDGLLDELNSQAAADQHVFTVLKGIPGTGKSHLIRWLKEQYALAHPNDAVLLIARSNTSLRTTIEQIIAAGVFDPDTLPDSLKRLQGAMEVLSQDTLAEQILGSLQIATRALDHQEVEHQLGTLHRRLSREKIEKFLLDIQVREKLKEPGGPIERVTTFLTVGMGGSQVSSNLPMFKPDDFVFGTERLRQIRNSGGYREVISLCDDLQSRSEIRESLTRYLSFALHRFAIGHATQLAAGDLRKMFIDLRRHLRGEGRSLALFIEDITAFTGIDQGLVEVLVTQHRGTTDAEYCRLLSVIGITDSWYVDFLPDNIKQRITHELTLNARTGRPESDLLRDPQILEEFAARYMNAMRMPQVELDLWASQGAQPDSLPNACSNCEMSAVCHAAFGAVKMNDAAGTTVPQAIGLYPFNRQAITSLYDYLRENLSRTPRTFLYDILAYILQSHGDKVAAGEFPPPVTELATGLNIPTFNPPAHDRVIEEQGGIEARRVKTLFLFWGERNVFATSTQDKAIYTIGGLSSAVLQAFRLPTISGVAAVQTQPIPPDAVAIKKVDNKKIDDASLSGSGKLESRFTQNISDWANGGRLFGFDRFADWIADLVRAFVDWQAYGISATQVREYVMGSRVLIEGQSGPPAPHRLYLRFERSDPDLRYVLQALADLNDPNYALAPAQYGEHLATLSHWLRVQEPRFVAFVREPGGLPVEPDYLVDILLENCTLLACLEGKITLEAANDPVTLYQQVIASCATSNATQWEEQDKQFKNTHPKEWVQLMRRVDTGKAVHRCRTELLQLLNRPQGASINVRFLDAAKALSHLKDFTQKSWQPSRLSSKPDTNDVLWTSAIKVHDALEAAGMVTWQVAQTSLAGDTAELTAYLDPGSTPSDMLRAIKAVLGELRQVRSFPAELDAPFKRGYSGKITGQRLSDLLAAIEGQTAMPFNCVQIAGLAANYASLHSESTEFLRYLSAVQRTLKEHRTQFAKEIENLRHRSDAEHQYGATLQGYDRLLALLSSYVPGEQTA
jgi:hypothetical protein